MDLVLEVDLKVSLDLENLEQLKQKFRYLRMMIVSCKCLLIKTKQSHSLFHPAIEAGFTSEYHVVEEDDDCRPNTVEVCVNSTGQIERPILFNFNIFSDSAKGGYINKNFK